MEDQTIKAQLNKALAAFQAELPKLRKDETAKVTGESQSGAKVSYSYGYADLAQVVETVSPALGKHGLAFTSAPTMSPNGFVLLYTLTHSSGEEITGTWPLPDPMRVKPQQLGSAITYARRYALMAVTNTFPDKEDDDGAQAVSAGHGHQDRPVSAPPAPMPPAKTSWTDDEMRELHDKLRTSELGKAVSGYDWMAKRGLHDRKVIVTGHGERTATEALATRMAEEALGHGGVTVREVTIIRAYAEDRGLLKVQVSETETLDQVLYEAKELAQHAASVESQSDINEDQGS